MHDHSNHIIPRKYFLDAYIDSGVELLSYLAGDTPDLLQSYMKKIVEKHYTPRLATIIDNPQYGSADLVTNVDVLKFFNKYNQMIFSPSGSVYYPRSKKQSVVYDFIQNYLTRRKILKKEMLIAKEKGDYLRAMIKHYGQSTMKIRVNSWTGGTGSSYSFCYHKPSFSSVTSLSRNMIMNAYAFVERFLIGNFFFPTFDSLLNYIALIGQVCPDKDTVYSFMDKYNLYKPDSEDLYSLFKGYLDIYTDEYDPVLLRSIILGIPDHKKTYLFYANNFYLLAYTNKDIIHSLAEKVFDESSIDYTDMENISPNQLFKEDGDILIMLNTHYRHLLDGTALFDIPKDKPEVSKKLVCISKSMEKATQPLIEIAMFFCNHKTTIDNVIMHKNMYRKVVPNSDTDSVIFTTKDWVEWYTGSYNFTQKAFDIDALITYLLSKSVGWLMYTMSEQRGAEGDDLKAMVMKNEFLYPVLMSCTIPKHYVGPITMNEGAVLAKPEFDIKGVSFRGSALPTITLDKTEDFLRDIIGAIYDPKHPEKVGDIDILKVINTVIEYEIHITQSLRKGDTTYLNIDPVKNKSEYANPDSSIYFNYECWRDVFEEKYGAIQIPTKCYVVPFMENSITSETYLQWLEQSSPNIYKKLQSFLVYAGDKKITRIPLNPILDKIPDELIPLVNIKSIVYKNCSPMYLALESLGISSGIPTKKQILFSDLYGVNSIHETHIGNIPKKENKEAA